MKCVGSVSSWITSKRSLDGSSRVLRALSNTASMNSSVRPGFTWMLTQTTYMGTSGLVLATEGARPDGLVRVVSFAPEQVPFFAEETGVDNAAGGTGRHRHVDVD